MEKQSSKYTPDFNRIVLQDSQMTIHISSATMMNAFFWWIVCVYCRVTVDCEAMAFGIDNRNDIEILRGITNWVECIVRMFRSR
jgi:hypothetical protein